MNKDSSFKYDVAISFAEEDRNIAICIYLALKVFQPDLKVFYYPEHLGATTGSSLNDRLPDIYIQQSKCVVMLVSEAYINAEKRYVPVEIKALVKRYKESKSVFLIPVLTDKTEVKQVNDSLPADLSYLKWDYDFAKLAKVIVEMLGKPRRELQRLAHNYYRTTINNPIKGTFNFGG